MHSAVVLELLDAQKCRVCGARAVAGATMCLACAGNVSMTDLARRPAPEQGGGLRDADHAPVRSPAHRP